LFLKYLVSTDHRHIGLLYAFTSLFFLLFGFSLVVIIRWQLAYPGEPVPYIGGLFGEANAPGGIILVHAHADRPVGDGLLTVVRPRPLPHARLLHGADAR
jgi:hypothetical protein